MSNLKFKKQEKDRLVFNYLVPTNIVDSEDNFVDVAIDIFEELIKENKKVKFVDFYDYDFDLKEAKDFPTITVNISANFIYVDGSVDKVDIYVESDSELYRDYIKDWRYDGFSWDEIDKKLDKIAEELIAYPFDDDKDVVHVYQNGNYITDLDLDGFKGAELPKYEIEQYLVLLTTESFKKNRSSKSLDIVKAQLSVNNAESNFTELLEKKLYQTLKMYEEAVRVDKSYAKLIATYNERLSKTKAPEIMGKFFKEVTDNNTKVKFKIAKFNRNVPNGGKVGFEVYLLPDRFIAVNTNKKQFVSFNIHQMSKRDYVSQLVAILPLAKDEADFLQYELVKAYLFNKSLK